MPADITLVNLNMLFIRYGEDVERELHVPLGCLYLARALEDSGFRVDFRDYQVCDAADPFDIEIFLEFMDGPSQVIGLSCMANLLPFTIIAARALKDRYPDTTVVLGGVGAKAVENQILQRFPWIDIVARGECERTGPELLQAIAAGDLSTVAGVSYRHDGAVTHNPDRIRITDLDSIPLPAFEKIDLPRYAGYGMMTSRGCPYSCTFCSVAPVWNFKSFSRSPENIVAEMKTLHDGAGVDMFLFQMVSFRTMGARILPSLLSLLPQTEIYAATDKTKLEFCRFLLPEFVFTGHEVINSGQVEIPEKHRQHFDLIASNPDIFPGFYHYDLENNVLPKLELLRQFGFYPRQDNTPPDKNLENCCTPDSNPAPHELATTVRK